MVMHGDQISGAFLITGRMWSMTEVSHLNEDFTHQFSSGVWDRMAVLYTVE